MAMQRPRSQCFDGLRDDLIIGYFWSLSLELQEPPVEIGNFFFFSLSTGQEVFFHAKLRSEPLEIEQELLL
jgi:hypothetical protein